MSCLALALLTLAVPMSPQRLRTEHLVEPLAIQSERPKFTWEVRDSSHGARQGGYQVQVRADGVVLWDSQRVQGPAQEAEYGGGPLGHGRQFEWRVRLWDASGRRGAWSSWSRFGTGLRESDWQGAWISNPADLPPPLPANNGFHSVMEHSADVHKSAIVDLGSVQKFDAVRLWPSQPFDFDPPSPGFLFPLRFRVEVSDHADMKGEKVLIDRTVEDFANPGADPAEFKVSAEGRYVRLVVTRLAQRDPGVFGWALAELEVLADGRNLALGAPVTVSDSVENGRWSARHLTDGDLRSHPAENLDSLPATQLRKEFAFGKKVRSAVLYASALGAYEARLNGSRVGDHILAPEWTDYHRRVQYQAYDVTNLVKTGSNALAAVLGDGWYSGRIGMAQSLDPRGFPRAVYGRKPWFRALLRIVAEDGSVTSIATDGTWKSSTEGPIRSSDIYDGESVDLGRETTGWDTAGFRGSGWQAALAEASPDAGRPQLVAQPNEPIRIVERLKPVSVTEPKPGVYVADMGQNMAGWVAAKVTAQPGTVIFKFAEFLNEDGTVYTDNLRGAPQTDRVLVPPGSQRTFEFRPHFTYHGFRYVQIEGAAVKPKPSDLTGEVFCSSAAETATFECSSALVNKLWKNVFWTQRANLMGVPTDCPQRDERLGWMGDILAFGQTASYNMDLAAFFTKWLQDVRDAQADDGRYPDFAPHPYGKNDRFTGVPGWGDAGVGCAWIAYLNSGDKRLLAEQFASAKRWTDWIASKNPGWVWEHSRGNDYGDWLNGDTLVRQGWDSKGGEAPKELFATLMWFESLDRLALMAEALGRMKEAQSARSQAAKVSKAFVAKYVQPDGGLLGDTQAGYALALWLGILPEGLQDRAFQRLVAALERRGYRLTTGFHSTLPMMEALSRRGRNDLAYRLLLSMEFPSWGYTIENGATTVWERWDGYVKGRGFQDPGMNSFNHWALGSVGQWLMETVGGIAPLQPGWARMRLAPQPGPGLDWARARFHSPRGNVACGWKVAQGRLRLDLTVPANAVAELTVPGHGPVSADQEFERWARPLGGRSYEVPAGTYSLETLSD